MEPVVHESGGWAPFMIDITPIFNGDLLDFIEEDGFGGSKWEIILMDDDADIGDGDELVLIEHI